MKRQSLGMILPAATVLALASGLAQPVHAQVSQDNNAALHAINTVDSAANVLTQENIETAFAELKASDLPRRRHEEGGFYLTFTPFERDIVIGGGGAAAMENSKPCGNRNYRVSYTWAGTMRGARCV